MNTKQFIEAAQNAETSIRLADVLHDANARIKRLESGLKEIARYESMEGYMARRTLTANSRGAVE